MFSFSLKYELVFSCVYLHIRIRANRTICSYIVSLKKMVDTDLLVPLPVLLVPLPVLLVPLPVQGALEWPQAFYVAGDNNDMAVSRTVNNISHAQKKRHDRGRRVQTHPSSTPHLSLIHSSSTPQPPLSYPLSSVIKNNTNLKRPCWVKTSCDGNVVFLCVAVRPRGCRSTRCSGICVTCP